MEELIIDSFAGGGGASVGLEVALGRHVDVAINHDSEAITMHSINHPYTKHYCEDVWKVDPKEATQGKPVGYAWFSPDCKFFSRAKGGKPVNKEIRGLAWVVIHWAKIVRPRVIFLENVEEFETWGPLIDDRPNPDKKGITFKRWIGSLRNLGYQVEWKSLRACDYGAPTTRRRLFLIARCDNQPIVWPEPTHGPGRNRPWKTAAECIDWSIPCPSIFDRKKPLAEATERRIAAGIKKFVIDNPRPFIVPLTHQGDPNRVYDTLDPFRTITAASRGELALTTPSLIKYHGGERSERGQSLAEPIRTLDTSNRFGLVSPTLIQTSWGEREGQAPRVPGPHKPLGTAMAGGIKHALIAAFLAKHYTGVVGSELNEPIHTITAKDHHSLVSAFLLKYYSSGQNTHSLESPINTITAKDRFSLVVIEGEEYYISDIGMRMLVPRELYRAQGFPEGYVIDPEINGKKLSKTAQVRMAGNSVVPNVAAAIVRANATLMTREIV